MMIAILVISSKDETKLFESRKVQGLDGVPVFDRAPLDEQRSDFVSVELATRLSE